MNLEIFKLGIEVKLGVEDVMKVWSYVGEIYFCFNKVMLSDMEIIDDEVKLMKFELESVEVFEDDKIEKS